MKSRLIRGALVLSCLGALMTALVGFAHTRPGRPVLAVLGRIFPNAFAARCPLGYDRKATPEERTRGRRAFASSHAGPTKAAARPALDWQLDVTTKAEILAWAKDHGVACTVPRASADLECNAIPLAQLGAPLIPLAVDTLWMNFDAHDRLASLTVFRSTHDVAAMSNAYRALTHELTERVGAPAHVTGDPATLGNGALVQAGTEYRFSDFYATARATNMGKGQLVLIEQYHSLRID